MCAACCGDAFEGGLVFALDAGFTPCAFDGGLALEDAGLGAGFVDETASSLSDANGSSSSALRFFTNCFLVGGLVPSAALATNASFFALAAISDTDAFVVDEGAGVADAVGGITGVVLRAEKYASLSSYGKHFDYGRLSK